MSEEMSRGSSAVLVPSKQGHMLSVRLSVHGVHFDHPAEVACAKFVYCKVTFCPFL